jgi:hypothetical protein
MAQEELGELREEVRSLMAENKALKREVTLLEKQISTESAPSSAVSGIAADLEQVKTLAKSYTALCEPFSSIFSDPNLFTSPCPPTGYLDPQLRFGTNQAAHRNGWLAQLYDFLPAHLHPMVCEHSDFETTVSTILTISLVSS